MSFSAATASGAETTPQKPAAPRPVDAQTSAAIGSATISDRKAVTNPSESAVDARSPVRPRTRDGWRLA